MSAFKHPVDEIIDYLRTKHHLAEAASLAELTPEEIESLRGTSDTPKETDPNTLLGEASLHISEAKDILNDITSLLSMQSEALARVRPLIGSLEEIKKYITNIQELL